MAKKEKYKLKKINIINRKAKHEYEVLSLYEAGIMLTGTEIKSVRAGNVNLKEAFCHLENGELFVKAMHIAAYYFGTYNNHETKRTRKLLLRKQELKKLHRRVMEKGLTIVPMRLYLSDRGYAKLEIALARGKKAYDKRATIKERENKRDLDRIKKIYRME